MNQQLRPSSSMELPATLSSTLTFQREEIEALKERIQSLEHLGSSIQQMVKHEIQIGNRNLLAAMSSEVRELMGNILIPHLVEAARSLGSQSTTFSPNMAEEMVKNSNQNPSSRLFPHQAESSASRKLKLLFRGSMPDSLVTFQKIKTQVELCDYSGNRVANISSDESPIMIEMFALKGGFGVDDRDWTDQDFDNNVAQRRKGKGDLLKGNYKILMTKGVANVSEISFTDNSTRYETFRLGARVKQGLPNGVQVKDAVSKPIRVKERRTIYNKPLKKMEDPTSSLRHIGPNRAETLAKKANIKTVRDLLQLYYTDKDKLEMILHLSEDQWSEIIEDTERCVLAEDGYKYHDEASGFTLVLDCFFRIEQVAFRCGPSVPYSSLSDSQKKQVDKLRSIAYEKRSLLSRTTSVQAESISTVDYPPKSQDLLSLPSGNSALGETEVAQQICSPALNLTCQGEQEEILSSPNQTLLVDDYLGAPGPNESHGSLSLTLQPAIAPACHLFTFCNTQTYLHHPGDAAADKPTTVLDVLPTAVQKGSQERRNDTLNHENEVALLTGQTLSIEGSTSLDAPTPNKTQGSLSLSLQLASTRNCHPFTGSNPQTDLQYSNATTAHNAAPIPNVLPTSVHNRFQEPCNDNHPNEGGQTLSKEGDSTLDSSTSNKIQGSLSLSLPPVTTPTCHLFTASNPPTDLQLPDAITADKVASICPTASQNEFQEPCDYTLNHPNEGKGSQPLQSNSFINCLTPPDHNMDYQNTGAFVLNFDNGSLVDGGNVAENSGNMWWSPTEQGNHISWHNVNYQLTSNSQFGPPNNTEAMARATATNDLMPHSNVLSKRKRCND